MKNLAILHPKISVSDIKFGDKISNYQQLEYTFIQSNDLDSYIFENPEIEVWVDKENKINSIACYNNCYLNGLNLINFHIDLFISDHHIKVDDKDKIYKLHKNKGRNEIVYTIYDLGLQLWTWRKKIVAVICCNYD